MFQELGKVTLEFIYKAIEFVINSHCGEVEMFMCFFGVGKQSRNSQQDDIFGPIANNAFQAFYHLRSYPSLQVGKGYKT